MDYLGNRLIKIFPAQSQKQTTIDLGFLDERGNISSDRERKRHCLSRPEAKGGGQVGRELTGSPQLWVCGEVLKFDRGDVWVRDGEWEGLCTFGLRWGDPLLWVG